MHNNLIKIKKLSCTNPEMKKKNRRIDGLIKRCVAFDDFVAVKFMIQAHFNLHFSCAAAVFATTISN